MDLADLTFEHFRPLVDNDFAIGGADAALQLVEATERPANPSCTQGFTLLFRGPAEPVFAQQTLELTHDAIGTQPIFVVPIDMRDDGAYYEAVFTR